MKSCNGHLLHTNLNRKNDSTAEISNIFLTSHYAIHINVSGDNALLHGNDNITSILLLTESSALTSATSRDSVKSTRHNLDLNNIANASHTELNEWSKRLGDICRKNCID